MRHRAAAFGGLGANRPPPEGVEYRLGSSIITTASPPKKAFGGAEVRGGDENGPISRRKSPSNGGPECRYDASLAAKHEIQASFQLVTYWKNIFDLKCRCYLKVHCGC